MNEIWRDIPGFEGFYQASTLGKIKSLPRNRKTGGYNVFYLGKVKEKIIKSQKLESGYLIISLSINGVKKQYLIHKLIALTFPEICGEPFPGAQVNHLNEDKTDNRAVNLRWCTCKENNSWGTKSLRCGKKLKNYPKFSKPVRQYTLKGEFVKEYLSTKEVERQTGFDNGNISKCCCGKHKQAYGYIWKYGKMSL